MCRSCIPLISLFQKSLLIENRLKSKLRFSKSLIPIESRSSGRKTFSFKSFRNFSEKNQSIENNNLARGHSVKMRPITLYTVSKLKVSAFIRTILIIYKCISIFMYSDDSSIICQIHFLAAYKELPGLSISYTYLPAISPCIMCKMYNCRYMYYNTCVLN